MEPTTPSRAVSDPAVRTAALHDRLTTIVLDGGGVADVAAALGEVVGAGVLVLDRDHHVLAAANGGAGTIGHPSPPLLAQALRAACEQGIRTRRTQHRPSGADGTADPNPGSSGEDGTGGAEAGAAAGAGAPAVAGAGAGTGVAAGTGVGAEAGAVEYATTPIVAGDEVLGILALAGERLAPGDLRSLEHAAQISALLLLRARTLAHAGHRLRGEFLEDVLDTPLRDPEGLLARAARLGLALTGPHTVLTARCRDSLLREQVSGAAAAFAAHGAGLAGDYRGNVVMLLPGDADPVTIARKLAEQLSVSVGAPVTVGAATAAPGADTIADAHRDAARCLDVLLALNRDGEGAGLDELGVYSLLFGRAGQDELRRFVDRTIRPLLDHDARRGDLLRTTLAYFECDANLAHTAANLYVHINTLYQRIDRITSLLGPDWRHGDHALQVHLALKVHSVLSSP